MQYFHLRLRWKWHTVWGGCDWWCDEFWVHTAASTPHPPLLPSSFLPRLSYPSCLQCIIWLTSKVGCWGTSTCVYVLVSVCFVTGFDFFIQSFSCGFDSLSMFFFLDATPHVWERGSWINNKRKLKWELQNRKNFTECCFIKRWKEQILFRVQWNGWWIIRTVWIIMIMTVNMWVQMLIWSWRLL